MSREWSILGFLRTITFSCCLSLTSRFFCAFLPKKVADSGRQRQAGSVWSNIKLFLRDRLRSICFSRNFCKTSKVITSLEIELYIKKNGKQISWWFSPYDVWVNLLFVNFPIRPSKIEIELVIWLKVLNKHDLCAAFFILRGSLSKYICCQICIDLRVS